jgi:hypothetical protein
MACTRVGAAKLSRNQSRVTCENAARGSGGVETAIGAVSSAGVVEDSEGADEDGLLRFVERADGARGIREP